MSRINHGKRIRRIIETFGFCDLGAYIRETEKRKKVRQLTPRTPEAR